MVDATGRVRRPWMTTAEAAARLGVKPQTLYAYVSRGMLTSVRTPGGRGSRFERAEVERLAARARPAPRAGAVEVVVDTELTLLDPGGALYYRGWDVREACATASFEQVAEWLWLAERGEPPAWTARPEALAVGRPLQAVLPASATVVDRLRATVAAIPPTDPMRHDRRPAAVALTARALVGALVDCLPSACDGSAAEEPVLRLGGTTRRQSIAARLWRALCPRPPGDADLGALNSALVLMADHELAASTLGARVAAGTWADPYLVVQTGMGILGGPLHGGSPELVRRMFEEVARGVTPEEAVGDRLRHGEVVPGFGHAVYRGPDPRAEALLELVAGSGPPPERWAPVAGIRQVAADRALPPPNVDFALAALASAADMVPGAASAITATARCAGWIAHAIEEYPHRLRFRPRAAYTGPEPGPS